MPVYDYLCECGVVTEARQAVGVETIVCRACGQDAKRQSVYLVSVLPSNLPTQAGAQSGQKR